MSAGQIREPQVLDALRSVMDPDLHRDIVSLGFIRNLVIEGDTVSFDVNLTTPACPVKDRLREQARQEAESERQRVAAATTAEMEKLKEQAQREIERTARLARKELRQHLAKRSVELARESVRNQMRPEDDTLLIKENIGELRRTTV